MNEGNALVQTLAGINDCLANHWMTYRGRTYRLDDDELPLGAAVEFLRGQVRALSEAHKAQLAGARAAKEDSAG